MLEDDLKKLLLLCGGVFVMAMILVQIYRQIAMRVGLIDIPDERKRHAMGTAPVGGLAIFSAFFLALPFIDMDLRHYHGMYAGLAILLATGLVDDKFHLSAKTKLAMQLLAGVCMVSWEQVTVTHLGDLLGLGPIKLGEFAIPFTLLCLIALINAVNMSDGIDGLAGGICSTALFWMLIWACLGGEPSHIWLIAILISAICGFLVFNFRSWWCHQALIFLGDAGSLGLGFTLGWFATELAHGKDAIMPPVTAVWILGLPVIDLTSLVFRRLLRGQSPFAADRSHLHHMFLRVGFSVRRTAVILVLLSAMLGAIGMAGWYLHIPDAVMFYAFITLTIGYNIFAMRPMKFMRALRTFHPEHRKK